MPLWVPLGGTLGDRDGGVLAGGASFVGVARSSMREGCIFGMCISLAPEMVILCLEVVAGASARVLESPFF